MSLTCSAEISAGPPGGTCVVVRLSAGRARPFAVVGVDGRDGNQVGVRRGEVGEAHRVLCALSQQRPVAVDAIADDPLRAGRGRHPPDGRPGFADFRDAERAGRARGHAPGARATATRDRQRTARGTDVPAGVNSRDRDPVRAPATQLDGEAARVRLPDDGAVAQHAVAGQRRVAGLGPVPGDPYPGRAAGEEPQPRHTPRRAQRQTAVQLCARRPSAPARSAPGPRTRCVARARRRAPSRCPSSAPRCDRSAARGSRPAPACRAVPASSAARAARAAARGAAPGSATRAGGARGARPARRCACCWRRRRQHAERQPAPQRVQRRGPRGRARREHRQRPKARLERRQCPGALREHRQRPSARRKRRRRGQADRDRDRGGQGRARISSGFGEQEDDRRVRCALSAAAACATHSGSASGETPTFGVSTPAEPSRTSISRRAGPTR